MPDATKDAEFEQLRRALIDAERRNDEKAPVIDAAFSWLNVRHSLSGPMPPSRSAKAEADRRLADALHGYAERTRNA